MKLGFAIPKQISNKISPHVTQKFPDITIIFITYSSIFEIPSLLSGKQSGLDMILFLGNTAMKYTASQISPTIPWESIPHTNAALLQRLLQLTLSGHDIHHITTDLQDKDLLYDTYREIGMDISDIEINITPPYTFNENFIVQTARCHEEQFRFKKEASCITIFFEVYRRLHESGVPAVYMTPTLPDIYNAIFKAQTSFLLKISRESQLVIVDIVIDERSSYSPLLADEYQLMFENMNVTKQIYDFAKKIQATVIPVTETEILLFSTRTIMETQTNKFHSFSIMEDIRKNTASTVSIGIGLGKTAMEAKFHARLGVRRAVKGGGNQLFLIYDAETIRGPIGKAENVPGYNISDSFLSISQRTGVSAYTLSQLHSIIVKEGKNEFTTAEIADLLNITTRTADRIIIKLMEFGYCFEVGKKFQRKNGRPSRILQLKI